MQSNYLNRLAKVLLGALAPLLASLPAFSRDRIQDRAESQAWKNLLFYSERVLRSDSGLVDDPAFYLSPEGKTNPRAEMEAFLSALKTVDPTLPENEQIPCRFPARTRWLRDEFPELPKVDVKCPRFDDWLSLSQAQGVAVIFSSYYVNNPSSMMGHSFLRLLRAGDRPSPLLDKAVNFAANPTTDIPLLHSIMGLTGQFAGAFSLTPYYSKVQEYANAESRDLWEYRLDFNPEETRRLLDSLWEVAPNRIDYYFFDENCSAILIYLLQNARPGLALSPDLGTIWVHPSDTLRLLYDHPPLVQSVTYRPSSRSRYIEQRRLLGAKELGRLDGLFREPAETLSSSLEGLSPEEQARVIDTAIAFIEFDENLYASKRPEKRKTLYTDLLKTRARNPTAPIKDFPLPERERPESGHLGQRWGLGLGVWDHEKGGIFEYRPGSHDASSPSIGYPPELSIELGRTQIVAHEDRSAYLQRFDLFRILSFNPSRSGRLPWSWRANLGYRDERRGEAFFDLGIGQAVNLFQSRENYTYLEAEVSPRFGEGDWSACSGAVLGLRFALGPKIAQLFEGHWNHCWTEGGDTHEERDVQSDWRWALRDQLELYVNARYLQEIDDASWSLGFYQYF